MSSSVEPIASWRRFFVPASRIGRRCLGCFAGGVVGFVMMVLSVASGQEGGETFSDNWWISGPALLAAAGTVAAFVIGSIAIGTKHERAVPVIVATVVGGLVTVFLVGEITTSH